MTTSKHLWLRILFLGLVLLFSHSSLGYTPFSSRSPSELFAQGLALFQKEKYAHAQCHLEAYTRLCDEDLNAVEARYYMALCAMKLGQPDGEERFHQFIKRYPKHCKAAWAYYQLGNFYFVNQDFAKSITYNLEVDQSVLDRATQYEFQYRLAYAYLNVKNFEQALAYFNNIKASGNAYCAAASYYAGYIAFKNEDYATALSDLRRANENPAYQSAVPYLVLQIYYKQQRFQDILDYIHEVRNGAVVLKEDDEVALLTAEAYFFTGDYVAAAQHYEEYIAIQDFAATSEVLYRVAYALYQAGETYKALKYFKELAVQEDAVGQSASYYAGLLYLKTDQKVLAATAFDKAQQLNFSNTIQREAAFQYAKVSYELENFDATIGALKEFRQTHTTSQHLSESSVLLSEAYLCTQDYDSAIKYIENLDQKPRRILQVYQQATFCKGSEYFNKAAYNQAINLFQKSLQYPFDSSLVVQAQLWLGESFSALQRYEEAVPAYQHVLGSTVETDAMCQQATYGLGYAYFNTAHYAEAIPQFVQYTRKHQTATPTAWLADARVRLADCYYATKNYQKALKSYDQAFKHDSAHVYYQKGIIYSLLDRPDTAQANFQAILDHYAHTVYYEKAWFETAHIDLVRNDYPKAIDRFTQFIREIPHSTLLPDVLLSRATAYVNVEQYDQAVKDYEQLLQQYTKHPNAQSALLGLSRIGMLEGQPEKYQKYLADYQAANPGAMEKIVFDIAKALFYDQYYTTAIKQFNEFVVRYPKSKLVSEAVFLIAEAHYRQDDLPSALQQYQTALTEPYTPFYNKILSRMGTLSYRKKDFSSAWAHYQELKNCAQNEKERYHALVGMIKASYALQHYEEARQYALQITEASSDLPPHITSEALLFLGKVAMQQGEHQAAQDYFIKIVQKNQGKQAVEAQYLLAQSYYSTQAYQQSLEALFKLNRQFPAYKEWTNKSFLLIAQNYLVLNEDQKAKATLQSIIDNAEEEAAIASAQQVLSTLKHKQVAPTQGSYTEEGH